MVSSTSEAEFELDSIVWFLPPDKIVSEIEGPFVVLQFVHRDQYGDETYVIARNEERITAAAIELTGDCTYQKWRASRSN